MKLGAAGSRGSCICRVCSCCCKLTDSGPQQPCTATRERPAYGLRWPLNEGLGKTPSPVNFLPTHLDGKWDEADSWKGETGKGLSLGSKTQSLKWDVGAGSLFGRWSQAWGVQKWGGDTRKGRSQLRIIVGIFCCEHLGWIPLGTLWARARTWERHSGYQNQGGICFQGMVLLSQDLSITAASNFALS